MLCGQGSLSRPHVWVGEIGMQWSLITTITIPPPTTTAKAHNLGTVSFMNRTNELFVVKF